jgi:hypothetical protein
MPTGFTDSLTPVAAFVEWLQPHNVLDVGVGGGRIGFLAREYGHVPWHPRARQGPVVIHGIEGYEPYLGALQHAIYDELFVEEALTALTRIAGDGGRYDLVVAADILEHFTPDEGYRLLDLCQTVGDVVMIATPSEYFDQESAANPLETHRSHWPERRLVEAGATAVLHWGATTVCLFGNQGVASAYGGTRGGGDIRWYGWLVPPRWERKLRVSRRKLQERRRRHS